LLRDRPEEYEPRTAKNYSELPIGKQQRHQTNKQCSLIKFVWSVENLLVKKQVYETIKHNN